MTTKTAIIYDKWLDSLGGGEMVACHIAKFLKENGYSVTIVCRKIVPLKAITDKLNINLKGITFTEIWNDEKKLQELTTNKDLFINISFIDYSVGKAKRNIYYAHFPTPTYFGAKGYVLNNILLPVLAKFVKPIEFINPPLNTLIFNHNIEYLLSPLTSIAYSYLNTNKIYKLKYFIYHQELSKSSLKSLKFTISNGVVINKKIYIDHRHNVIKYILSIKPNASTIYFKLIIDKNITKIYLIEPQLYLEPNPSIITKFLEDKLYKRIRSGIFGNINRRLDNYSDIIVHSDYVAFWVKKYWHRSAKVLYPPVEMLFKTKKINYAQKNNIICSVGRFFTLGHSKKQDTMINAFKKMCDHGLKDWELHLAGGLNNEPTSLDYFKKLQDSSLGYPIVFHINKSRQEIIDLYYKSKIYWHAAGFGQNKNKDPINFEHFGITPIEAMSAGCIPVMFNGGGLPEIITALNLNHVDHLFNNESELINCTQKIIDKHTKTNINLQDLDSLFSTETFYKNLKKIIN